MFSGVTSLPKGLRRADFRPNDSEIQEFRDKGIEEMRVAGSKF
jgi:hypothetical protein